MPSMAGSLDALRNQLIEADFFQLGRENTKLLANADVIFINNLCFQDLKPGGASSTNGRLLELFGNECKQGAFFISSAPLNTPHRRSRMEPIETHKGWNCTVPEGSVSWTDSSVPFFFSRKAY